MASYVNRRERTFHVGTVTIPRIRSEFRMKLYESSTDARAWADFVEQRRHHILEYQARSKVGRCLEPLLPPEMVLYAAFTKKNDEKAELLERQQYLEEVLRNYQKMKYTEEQKKQLNKMLAKIKARYHRRK